MVGGHAIDAGDDAEPTEVCEQEMQSFFERIIDRVNSILTLALERFRRMRERYSGGIMAAVGSEHRTEMRNTAQFAPPHKSISLRCESAADRTPLVIPITIACASPPNRVHFYR